MTYATFNVQGSCNNLCDTAPDTAEWSWLATKPTSSGCRTRSTRPKPDVVGGYPDHAGRSRLGRVGRHAGAAARSADTEETDGMPDGYEAFLLALRDEVIAFGSPVAYIHGDSHYFRIDKPLLDCPGSSSRKLHARRDLWRQCGQRQQRRATG